MFARNQGRRRSLLVTMAMVASLLVAPSVAPAAEPVPGADFTLTILHNNDGESQLIDAGSGLEDFGGVAKFKTLVDTQRAEAVASGNGVLMLSSGDNFLAGPEFNASLEKGIPFYDAIAIEAIGYDAISLGNHDFDFGPDVLVDFLNSYTTAPRYLNANLDFSGEPGLQAFVDSGTIAPSTVITTGGQEIGIVGAVTPDLRSISSPRGVVVDADVAGAIQSEVDALEAAGVDKIVVISHLQDIEEDIALAADLSGVDVMIAGGGDELLANPGDLLVPGEEEDVFGTYPLIATGADGAEIPVVTTPGEYKYLGQLSVGFDADGNVIGVGADSGPKVVDASVVPDPDLQASVVDPVVAATAALAATTIGTSEVALDGTRAGVRSVETNEGNLIADALRWQAATLADSFGVKTPDVAIQNGGGIRNNTVIEAGDITLLDTFDMVPFPNFVTVIEDIDRTQFKEILENAYSQVPGGGRFAQISGFSVQYDPAQTAQELDDDGMVITPGERVLDVTLDDGTQLVADGAVVAGDPITIATIDFLARGGDQYPYRGAPFTSVGVSYQQALANYITGPLAGLITAADYPEGGEGRITAVIPPIEGPFTPIYEVQGSADASPLAGQTVEVSGYVTGVFADLGGFFLQDPAGDGDPATSDGVFIAADDSVAPGEHVEVRGVVEEFFEETRIIDVSALEVEEGGGNVEPAAITLPLAEGDSLESYEGMLVTFPEYLFVTDTFNLHRFGEALLAAGGVLVNPTDTAAPGDAANAVAAANSARSIVIDDGSGTEFPDPVPYFGDDGTLRRGDAAKGITANLSFGFGSYKLQPTGEVEFTRMNPRPGGPDDVGGNLTVASFNVLNFFSTIDDGENNARGADSESEKAAQLEKLVTAIGGLDADIIGLQEIENNGPVAIGELIDALNAEAGAGTWAAAADPDYPGGLEATNAIKVGIIFKPASVTPVGGTEVSEDPIFGADRPPIAHAFSVDGDTFTVIVNHFKSKSSRDAEGPDLDQGDGQGAYNFRRTEQARALLEFTDELVTGVGDPDVLVIGDFNSYSLEDPITTLETALTNLVKENVAPVDSYSLVFFGAQGLLDGAFATDTMTEKVTGIDIWHINADEPRVLQYNDDVVDPGERSSDFNQPVSQPDEFSSSDHDPIVIGLDLGEEPAISLSYSGSRDRANPADLDGAVVSGRIYPFVSPLDPGLGFTTVDFYLDGRRFHTERLAPYDFVSGNIETATAWNTQTVDDGEHSIRAVGNLPGGATLEVTASFTVDNVPDPLPAEFSLASSSNRDRSGSVPLDGGVVSGTDVYIFVDPLFPAGFESFGSVRFYLDGVHFHTEYQAPYDFVSGGVQQANESWDSTTVEDGEHSITVQADVRGGPDLTTTVTFIVDNEPDPAPPEPMVIEGEIDGAPYRIVIPGSPDLWNGGLITYAHGYVDALDHPSEGTERAQPVAAPGGASTEDALVALGYAVAGSQYKTDGWAVEDGIVDTEALTRYFAQEIAVPDRSVLWGFSMGSVIAGNLAENSDLYDGVIPACFVGAGAPRAFDGGLGLAVAYDAAFGWPESWGSVGDVRDDLDFETEVLPVVGPQLFANPLDPGAGLNPDNLGNWLFVQAASGIPAEDFFEEWLLTDLYFATEARAELERRAGGPAAQNVGHVYSVSDADRTALEGMGVDVNGFLEAMNQTDITADPAARQYLVDNYAFTGDIGVPVLAIHTVVDGLVPVEHESAYSETVNAAGTGSMLVQVYTDTYPEGRQSGHCTFTPDQLGATLAAMELWIATGSPPGPDAFSADIGFVPGFVPDPWPQPPPSA